MRRSEHAVGAVGDAWSGGQGARRDFDSACALRAAGRLLGIVQQSVDEWFRGGADRATVEAAIADRQEARRRRDYKRADAIRAEWSARGVVFEDRPDGTTSWSVVAGSDGR